MKKSIIESKNQKEFKLFGLDISQISLIIMNLIPLIGVLLLNWSITLIILTFWVESLIIGFYFTLKLIKYYKYKEQNKIPYDFIGGFLLFFLIYSLCIFFLVNISDSQHNNINLDKIYELSEFQEMIFFFNIFKEVNKPLILTIILLIFSHGISYYTNFLIKEEYKGMNIDNTKKFQDRYSNIYSRFIFIHILVLFGTGIILLFNSHYVLAIFFVLLKTLLDLFSHNREHNTPIFKKNY